MAFVDRLPRREHVTSQATLPLSHNMIGILLHATPIIMNILQAMTSAKHALMVIVTLAT